MMSVWSTGFMSDVMISAMENTDVWRPSIDWILEAFR
jgi:hypothetical protein